MKDSFPMSEYFRNKGIEKLSSSLRHLAVQSTSRWNSESLNSATRKHYYRAVLEVLFVRHGIKRVVGRQPDRLYRRPFNEYVRAVVEKLGLSADLIQEADIIDSYDTRDVLCSIVLRGMCAGTIETLILLDRYMAVRERLEGGYVGLHRLFNPEISPRSWAIVASR